MVQPLNNIPAHLLASTCAVLSEAGWTDCHAAWLRKDSRALLVRNLIDGQMAAEATALENEETVRLQVADDSTEGAMTAFKCPHCQLKYSVKNTKLLAATNGEKVLLMRCRCRRNIRCRRVAS